MSTDDLEQFAVPDEQPAPIEEGPPVSREAKIGFLAHILTGAPFMERYEIAGVGFVEFATVSAGELDSIRRLAQIGVPVQYHSDRLRALMAVACVNRLELDHRILPGVRDRLWGTPAAYDDFVSSIPTGLLHIIESQYLDFSRTLSLLISKVTDRSFWPTP